MQKHFINQADVITAPYICKWLVGMFKLLDCYQIRCTDIWVGCSVRVKLWRWVVLVRAWRATRPVLTSYISSTWSALKQICFQMLSSSTKKSENQPGSFYVIRLTDESTDVGEHTNLLGGGSTITTTTADTHTDSIICIRSRVRGHGPKIIWVIW